MMVRPMVEYIIDKIKHMGFEGEVFASEGYRTSVDMRQKNVEKAQKVSSKGYGIRLYKDRKMGFAYSNDWSKDGIDKALQMAKGTWELSDEMPEIKFPGGYHVREDEREEEESDIKDILLKLEDKLYTDSRVFTDNSSVVQSCSRFVVMNTAGGLVDWWESMSYLMAWVLLRGKKGMNGSFAFTFGKKASELDIDSVVSRAIARAESSLDGDRLSVSDVPVVFDTYEFAMIFLSAIGQFDGEAVGRGKSYLAGKKDQRIADYGFYLIDGPEHPDLPFKIPFDHEGMPVQKKELLSSGVVRSFMYDLKSAAEFGAVSTGNGFRHSWASLPSVSPAITYIEIKGKKPLSDLDKYFLVTSVKGVHSGFSPISGTMSVGVDGVFIDGDKRIPVQGVTVSGNFWEMLGRIAAADSDVEFLTMGSGVFGAPKVAFEGLKITG